MALEVGVRAFRSRLGYWLDRAAKGDEIIVTQRGKPRARITGVDHKTTRQRLVEKGLITPATKPKGRIDVDKLPTMREGTLTEILLEQRRKGP